MGYILSAVAAKPRGLWKLGGSSPFPDYSGHGNPATSTGSVSEAISLVSGADRSTVVSSAATVQFPVDVYQQGMELTEFSLEAWVYPINPTDIAGRQQIIGNIDLFDGLTIDGTVVSFSTNYSDAPECMVKHDIKVIRPIYLVAVHTLDSNFLFANGELVGEVALSDEQRAGTFIGTAGTLFSGDSDSPDLKLAVNGVGVYNYALSGEQVLQNYHSGRRVVGPQVINSYFGLDIPLEANKRLVAVRNWSSNEDWQSGTNRGVALDTGDIVPQVINGVSVAGEWYTVCDLYTGPTPSKLSAVTLDWDGVGIVVETSIDGTTWTAVSRGVNISTVPDGFDPTDKELLIRVLFSGGAVDDEAYLSSLTAKVFSGNTETIGNRTITYRQPVSVTEHRQSDHEGILIGPGGQVTISADSSSSPVRPQTVEILYRPVVTDLTLNFSGTVYTNGLAGTDDTMGSWRLLHITSADPLMGSLILQGQVQVGRIVLYANELTAENVNNIYKSYVGVPVTRIGDNSVVGVAELAQASKIYAHDWSIEAAG